jgi:phosphoribosylanthranilate isomerase
MSSLKVKVCGLRDAENIRSVAALEPDYLGFIFYEGSPRYVGKSFFIPDDLPSTVKSVGVFVNESAQSIQRLASLHALHAVQLHGNESVEQCLLLKTSGLEVIKAFAVDNDFDFSSLKPYQGSVDYFLFDTRGKNYGGNGMPFNWELLNRYDLNVPFFLSGGLSNQNMQEVLKLSYKNLVVLDVNSGVETAPGVKDVQQVEQFILYTRNQLGVQK